VKVGSSNTNLKVIQLPGVCHVDPHPVNGQHPSWRDRFAVTVGEGSFTVRRVDSGGGWGQPLELNAFIESSDAKQAQTAKQADSSGGFAFYKLTIESIRNGSAGMMQLTSCNLYANGRLVTEGKASNPNGRNPYNEGPGNALDSSLWNKWLDFNFVSNGCSTLCINFPAPVSLSQYELVTGNDEPDRDPTAWSFAGSADGKSWTTLDYVSGFSAPSRRVQSYGRRGLSAPAAETETAPETEAWTCEECCAEGTTGAECEMCCSPRPESPASPAAGYVCASCCAIADSEYNADGVDDGELCRRCGQPKGAEVADAKAAPEPAAAPWCCEDCECDINTGPECEMCGNERPEPKCFLRLMFEEVDLNKDGFISFEEAKIKTALERGKSVDDLTEVELEDIKSFMAALDTDGDGRISLDEYLRKSTPQSFGSWYCKNCEQPDNTGEHCSNCNELHYLGAGTRPETELDRMKRLFAHLDLNHDGKVGLAEGLEATARDLGVDVSALTDEQRQSVVDYIASRDFDGDGALTLQEYTQDPVRPSADGPWTCSVCDAENTGGDECDTCGSERPAEQPVANEDEKEDLDAPKPVEDDEEEDDLDAPKPIQQDDEDDLDAPKPKQQDDEEDDLDAPKPKH
jgi:Ca2+-binding EF-hand superfamily protein